MDEIKLLDDKTEFMLFVSRQQLFMINIEHNHIGNSSVASASNLGILMLFLLFHDNETTHLQCHPFFSILTTKHQQDSRIL